MSGHNVISYNSLEIAKMPSKNNNLQSSLRRRSNTIKNEDKKFLQIRYTDVPGRFLASYISDNNDNFKSIFSDGAGLDGSSVQGFADITNLTCYCYLTGPQLG